MNAPSARTVLTLLAPALLLLGACSGGGGGSVNGGGKPPPPPPPPPPSFTLEDLMGDWVGQLEPDAPDRPVQNVYLRFASDELVECADSAGNEWTLTNSDRNFTWSARGRLRASLALQLGTSTLELDLNMNAARAVLRGDYVQVGPDLIAVPGRLVLTRSGAGAFDLELLEGTWEGKASRDGGVGMGLEFGIAADGSVLGGALRRRDGSVRRLFPAGAGTFAIFDDAIGRLQDVTVTGVNGVSCTFHYLLVDASGTLLAGPGTDQVLGAGLIRLAPR
jgi:hypothetical protein